MPSVAFLLSPKAGHRASVPGAQAPDLEQLLQAPPNGRLNQDTSKLTKVDGSYAQENVQLIPSEHLPTPLPTVSYES